MTTWTCQCLLYGLWLQLRKPWDNPQLHVLKCHRTGKCHHQGGIEVPEVSVLLKYSYLIQSPHLLHFSHNFIFPLTSLSETKSSYLFQTPLQSSLLKTEVSDSSLDLYSFTYFLNDSDTFYLGSYTYRDMRLPF